MTEPIWIECEGSNLVGHAVMGDGQPLVMCQMCGQTYIPAGVYGSVPDHDRPDYLTCPDWIAGNGTVSSLTFTSATCGYSLGHRNRHQCDCVCVRPAGHDGPHQCSAEAVRP